MSKTQDSDIELFFAIIDGLIRADKNIFMVPENCSKIFNHVCPPDQDRMCFKFNADTPLDSIPELTYGRIYLRPFDCWGWGNEKRTYLIGRCEHCGIKIIGIA